MHTNIVNKYVRVVKGSGITTNKKEISVGDETNYSKDTFLQLEDAILKILIIKSSSRIGFSRSLLNSLTPYYSALLDGLQKKYVGGFNANVDTLGVNCSQMIINVEFVYSMPESELNFILLHEIDHLSNLHMCRRGRRDPRLWNVACDYYINKRLAVEYGLEPTNLNAPSSKWVYPIQTRGNVLLRLPVHSPEEIRRNPLLISGLYDPKIDLNNDSPEKIYTRLINKGSKIPGGNDSADKGANGDLNISELNNNTIKKIMGSMTNEELAEMSAKASQDINRTYSKVNSKSDIQRTPSEKEVQKLKGIIQKAMVKATVAGNAACGMQRQAEELLKPKFNLRSLLRQYLQPTKSEKLSYSNINKRLIYRNVVLPAAGELKRDKLSRVKICIDTSGSIGSTELKEFLELIYGILVEYKVSAEIIYWDSACYIGGTINTKNSIADFTKAQKKLYGGGGTDPACLFRYFESKECIVKPYAIFIFTDGYIYGNSYEAYARKYKNVLWIISDRGNPDFSSRVGIVKHWKDIEKK